jgi:phage gp36-like protein
MAYFTQTDLENTVDAALVLRLLDDDNDGTVDSAPLAAVQLRVQSEMRGYLGRRYTLSTLEASPPESIRLLACELAVEFCYRRRPELANERGETPWNGRYKEAIRRLGELRDGRFRVDVDGVPETPANVQAYLDTGTDDDYPDGIGNGVFALGFGDF